MSVAGILADINAVAANTLGNAARASYDLTYQQSPIILAGGLFSGAQGGVMPVIQLMGDVSAPSDTRFIPLPGATAISNSIGTYPFANRYVAGNAVIRNPKNISLLMIAPVNSNLGYLSKQTMFTALQATFEAHTAAGGTYHVMTPSYPYYDCLMTAMTDVTSGEGRQQQIQWQIDFVQPLITQQNAAAAYNALMGQISGGQQVTSSSWSKAAATSGQPVQGTPGYAPFPG